MTSDDGPSVLRRALDQLADLLDEVPGGALADPTPCPQWTVQALVDRIVAAPSRFARMARGEAVDWSETPSVGRDAAARFRSHAEDLLAAVADDAAPDGADPCQRTAAFAGRSVGLTTLPAMAEWAFGPEQAGAVRCPVPGAAALPPFVEVAALLRSSVPDLEERTIEGVGHLLHLQRPEPVARAIGDFLSGHPMARG